MKNAESLSTCGRTVRTYTALTTAFVVFAALAVQARHHHAPADRSGEAGQFDHYVLSLSWAPTYCLTHANDSEECSGKGYGFVLHGLGATLRTVQHNSSCRLMPLPKVVRSIPANA